MCGRLKDKAAIVVGAGQTPGDTLGNGQAPAILFAREGARVMLADYRLDSFTAYGRQPPNLAFHGAAILVLWSHSITN